MFQFNDLLSKHELTEEQLTLCRDIRRRGKNKVREYFSCFFSSYDFIFLASQDALEVIMSVSESVSDSKNRVD